MKKYRITFVSVFLVILLTLSNNTLVRPLNNGVNEKQLGDQTPPMDDTTVNGMSKASVSSQEDLVGTPEDSISQISTLSTQEVWSDSDMNKENPLLHSDVPSPDVASEVVNSSLEANGGYQLIWEPNRVQGSVHSVAAYPIDEYGNAIVAIGAGYLYDNEIHIYRWDAGAERGTHVWDVGDGVIMGDVLSLAFADSDKDGFIEIVAGCADGKIYVFEQRSASADNPLFNQFQLVWDSAKEVGARVTSVAVDDLDLDGFREIIAGSWSQKVYVYEYTVRYGTPGSSQHRHWYAKVWDSGTTIKGLVNSMATGDTDADSFREIVVGCSDSVVYVFENNRSVGPEPVYAHMDNAYGLVWNSSDLIFGPVQSVAVDGNRIVASSSGHGVYVFDYDLKLDKYRMEKLFRGVESWEEDTPFPIDVFVDSKVSGNKTTGVFEPTDIRFPYSLLREHATAMAGPLDWTIDYGGCTTLNATATKEGVATTVLDFGNDEEITGTGNIGIDFFLVALERPGTPVPARATLENFELYVSKDNINFAKVEEGISLSRRLYAPYYPTVLTFAVDIDPTLREERWEWFRFLKIETTTTVLVDGAMGTLNRPVSDALVVSTGYVPGLSASTTDHTIIVGTVAGNIKVFLQDPKDKYYTHVWDSYSKIPLYQPGTNEYRRRLSLGTNIWSIDLLSSESPLVKTFMVVGTYPKVSFIHVDPTTLEASVTWDTIPVLDRWTMSLAIADTDGDGKKEVVVGSFDNNIYTFEHVYRNTYRRAWRSPDLKHNETFWDHVNDLVLGDIDQDGNMEIIAATDNQTYPMIHIFENIGNDLYTAVEGIELPLNSGPITALAIGNDLDNDTAVELLVADKNNLYLFEIKDTTLTSEIIYSIGPTIGIWEAQAIVTGDTDQDNYGEIIVGGNVLSQVAGLWGFVQILENYGNETVTHLDNKFEQVWLAPGDHIGFENPVFSVILGDQDDDGKNEIIVGHQKGINVYENTGDNTFETSHIITSSPNYPSIQLTEITDLMPDYYPRDPREQWDEWEEPLEMSAPIVQLSNGSFIVVYTSRDPGVTEDTYHTQTRLFYRVSEDGVTWSDELRVTSDEQAIAIDPLHLSLYYERSPSIVVTPWDTVWVVFEANFWVYAPWEPGAIYLEHNPTIMTAKIGSRHPSRLDMREIVQGGFSPSIYWNSASGSPEVTYLNSTLYRLWFDPTAPRLLHLSSSTWHEVEVPGEKKPFCYLTWSAPQLLNTKIGRGYRAFIQEATYLNDGSLAVVFDGFNETATKTDFDIWVTISNGTDVTVWSDPCWVSISNYPEVCPSITTLRDGVLMITFLRVVPMPEQIDLRFYAVASSNNGLSWTEPKEIPSIPPTSLGKAPAVASSNNGQSWTEPNQIIIVPTISLSYAPAVSSLTSGGFMYTFHVGNPYVATPSIYFGKNPHVGWWDFTIGSVSHLALGNTDNNTLNEIIATSDKTIYILELNATGTDPQTYQEVWTSQQLAQLITDIAIGDIDNDGKDEIVVTAARGNVYAFKWIEER